MRKTYSDFDNIHPFIQSLRPSLQTSKDAPIEPLVSNPILNNNQVLNFKPREKSLSKSKILRVTRKFSLGTNFKQIQKNSPQSIYSQNSLEINFNKICAANLQPKSLSAHQNNQQIQNSFDLKNLKISLIFCKAIPQNNQPDNPFVFQNNQNPSKSQNLKIKLQITCFQLSIEDESKVKRTFDINLVQKLDKKQFLKIQISEGLKPQFLSINNKIITSKENSGLTPKQQDKIGQIKPWQLANQRKSLLQDKILSERPKSKIKWSFSLTQSCQNFGNDDEKFRKGSGICQYYGMKNSHENGLKQSFELKSKSHLNLNMPKHNPYMNVFSPNVKEQAQLESMKSTFDSDDRSSRKQQQFGYLNGVKRANNMVESLQLKENKAAVRQSSEEGSKAMRPKSSFKSLKQKNDYFQMKESERKKSIQKMGPLLEYQKEKVGKSSEIKQEYGIS